MNGLADKARDYAISAHSRINQLRKYTFQPYDVHLRAVADLVSMATDDQEIIAAAWLHDTVEDTPATFEDIEHLFGRRVSRMVMDLTDVSRLDDGNRTVRKEIDRDHSAMASPEAKTIKLADLIDNCLDICKHDTEFGAVFLQEMVDLLSVLHEGDQKLYRKAVRTVEQSAKKLGIKIPEPTDIVYREDDNFETKHVSVDDEHGMRVFTKAFTARDVMETLTSYDAQMIKPSLFGRLATLNTGAIGVMESGKVRKYLLQEDISFKRLDFREIEKQQQVDLDAPLSTVIHVLTMFSCCFVMINNDAVGVITRQDIEKPVVRMWLFGIIIVIEMMVVKHIRLKFVDDDWTKYLTGGRIDKAKELQRLREERGTKADLLDCLQFSDKLIIALNEKSFFETSGFLSNKAARRAIKELEALRNNLAHGQDITSQDWPPIARLAKRVQGML